MTKQERKQERVAQIIALLEKDGRAQLTEIATTLNIPTSTVFDYMKEIREAYEFKIVKKEERDQNSYN